MAFEAGMSPRLPAHHVTQVMLIGAQPMFGSIVVSATELVPLPVLQALDRAGTRVCNAGGTTAPVGKGTPSTRVISRVG